jgi:hypothetical protein
VALGVASTSSDATTPPPSATFATKLCRATHVFIGTAHNFRVVATAPPSEQCAAMGPETLSPCQAVEVDVAVEEVLWPTDWRPTRPITYRFGGGLFSIRDLQRDLEGNRLLFHTVRANVGGANDIFTTSYEWSLARSATSRDEAATLLGQCERK